MSFFISNAIAAAEPTAAQGSPLEALILPIGLIVLFYFFLIRPQNKRQKEHKQMVGSLQKGEEVITTGGILGKITNVSENFLTLEISKDACISVQKNSIQAIMPKGTIKEEQQ